MDKYETGFRGAQEATAQLIWFVDDRTDKKVIYFDGWNGFGAVPVLRSVAKFHKEKRSISQESHSSELCFDRIIYIDCSAWENKREMQRKIAEELQLDHATMEMFDKRDEEDDFNGVDRSSRDVIRSVAAVIDQSLRGTNSMMIFLNGSHDEIDPNIFGISLAKYHDNVVIWTFKRRSLTIHNPHEIASKLRYTDIFFYSDINKLSHSRLSALFHEEATSIVARHTFMQGIDLTMVTDCCLYQLLLHYIFHTTTGFGWMTHGSNYWMCDGITKGDTTIEIASELHEEISFKSDGIWLDQLFEQFVEDPKAPFFIVNDRSVPAEKLYQIRPYRWASITSKILAVPEEDMQIILGGALSLFVAFERSDKSSGPPDLPNGLFKHCSNLAVLVLSLCAFSFVSPPFLECQTIKFLGLEHCTDMTASKAKYSTNKWEHLHSLWVLDIRYTEWEEILTEEKIEILANLRELNIVGFKGWQHTSQLEKRLPYLETLRMIKPIHSAATIPVDTRDPFMDKKRLKLLDLSGNKDMKYLPTSITNASSLEVLILDGCDGLENVVLSSEFHSLLRSFSFDGYGPALHWTSMVDIPPESSRLKSPSDANERDVKTLKISLQGCKQFENLFLRGLPNLVELDLSGSTIKILDFNTMVVDVPNLERLFLLGCEHLRAIISLGSNQSRRLSKLKLLCIDTRPGWSIGCTRPSLVKHKSFGLQAHVVIRDIRLGRSLGSLMSQFDYEDLYFNIHITSSTVCDSFIELEANGTETIGLRDQKNLVLAGKYGDVFNMISDGPSLMEAFLQPLTLQSDHHIEIGDGIHNMESEMVADSDHGLPYLIREFSESLNVHDSSTISSLLTVHWSPLRWCRVVRCSKLDTIFPRLSVDGHGNLEIIWASDLLMARCIWSKGAIKHPSSFGNLQHLHLGSCPRLQFVLPVWVPSFPNLRTLHIIHCGDLGHVFVLNEESRPEIPIHGVPFPKLTTIFLHDLPKLRQISELKMLAPMLETIRIKGCFGLRRLPSLKGREPGMKKPVVEIEKDVWDALEWDGLAAGHHSDLFGPPVHSRYYKRRLLNGTVLR